MREPETQHNEQRPRSASGWTMTARISVGAGVGTALGVAAGELEAGLALGLAFGLAWGLFDRYVRRKRSP
ncbi:MAG: hypothetical protein KatS3mg043_1680 [Rhodothermaceae bacterium]|nr:MAG: hypothetical protein KatS3mg043_1680 [Rhodothermaceae bacterium]